MVRKELMCKGESVEEQLKKEKKRVIVTLSFNIVNSRVTTIAYYIAIYVYIWTNKSSLTITSS